MIILTDAVASLDIANAHTSVARIATYLVLAAEARRTGHILDRLECLYRLFRPSVVLLCRQFVHG